MRHCCQAGDMEHAGHSRMRALLQQNRHEQQSRGRRISTRRVVLFLLAAFSITSCLIMFFFDAAVPGITADPGDPCENSCPDGWTKRLKRSGLSSECCLCDAPSSYSGPCDRHSHFLSTEKHGHSRSKRIEWANSCQVRWTACDSARGSADEEVDPAADAALVAANTVQLATTTHDDSARHHNVDENESDMVTHHIESDTNAVTAETAPLLVSPCLCSFSPSAPAKVQPSLTVL